MLTGWVVEFWFSNNSNKTEQIAFELFNTESLRNQRIREWEQHSNNDEEYWTESYVLKFEESKQLENGVN